MERRYDHECECFYLRPSEFPLDEKVSKLVPEDGLGPEIWERQIGEDTYKAYVYVEDMALMIETEPYTLIKDEEVEAVEA